MQLEHAGAAPPSRDRPKADEVLDPEDADHRLRPPLRHLQTRHPAFSRSLDRLTAILNQQGIARSRSSSPARPIRARPRRQGADRRDHPCLPKRRPRAAAERMVFIEDYDVSTSPATWCRASTCGSTTRVGRWRRRGRRSSKVCGQRRPQHAPILDGWWCEGYTGDNGWAIGAGEEYTDLDYQDDIRGVGSCTTSLEQEIASLFYTRGNDGLPRGWLKAMKRSMSTLLPRVQHRIRHGAGVHGEGVRPRRPTVFAKLTGDKLQRGGQPRQLARSACCAGWSGVRVESGRRRHSLDPMRVGCEGGGASKINLGGLTAGRRGGAALSRRRRQSRRDHEAGLRRDEHQRHAAAEGRAFAVQGEHPAQGTAAASATPSA